MEPVKISSLELENVKRIRAVQIVPSKDGLTVIGGRNGQGKTSVLDASAWALGGKKMQPENRNRDGAATPAKLHVELSNGIVVERRGKNGTLYVKDTTGKKGTQKLLNEFLSELALNLPAFLGGTDKERTTALLHTLGIDEQLANLDGQLKALGGKRQLQGQDARTKRAHASSLPKHEDAPDEFVSVADLIQQQQAILARNGENQRLRNKVSTLEWACQSTKQTITHLERQVIEERQKLDEYVKTANERIARLQGDLDGEKTELEQQEADLEVAHKTADELLDESTAEIEASIANIEAINEKVRDNQRREEAEIAATKAEEAYKDMTASIESLREQRVALLDNAPLPLDGLSVDEAGSLTYLGQTWGDMSGSEQLHVATAIVRATKPECGFVLVDGLEQLDTQTLAEFAEWAQGEGLQVIGTRVGNDDACTIIIEDGRVEGQEIEEAPAPDPKGKAVDWNDSATKTNGSWAW